MPELSELTDREWYLVRLGHQRTLEAVLKHCEISGLPGRLVAVEMLRDALLGRTNVILLDVAATLLKGYKPGADPR